MNYEIYQEFAIKLLNSIKVYGYGLIFEVNIILLTPTAQHTKNQSPRKVRRTYMYYSSMNLCINNEVIIIT